MVAKQNMGMVLDSLGNSRLALGEFVSVEERRVCGLDRCSMVDRTAKIVF